MTPSELIESVYAEVVSLAESTFSEPWRRPYQPEAIDAATDSLIQSSELFDPSKGEFLPFAKSRARVALRNLWANLSRVNANRPKHESSVEGLVSRKVGYDSPDLVDSFEKLTPTQREVVRRHILEGETIRDIANSQGITRDAAHKNYRKAISELSNAAKNN